MAMMRGWLRSDFIRAKYLLYAFIVVAAIAFGWLAKQSYAVYKLTRGVGDTWFHTADGRRWFRLDEQRHDVPIAAIAPHLQHAFVAVEDHRFFLHPGVDPIALGRAVVRNVRGPASLEGGSTLTQQLARTLFLSNRKSYGRKAREAVIAFLIEVQLTKQQILELYLNRIFLGAGIYGVEAMSQRVFGKPAKNLTLARERADRRPGARAGGAVAVVEPRRGASGAATSCSRGCATRASSPRRRMRDALQARFRVRPYRSDSDGASRLRQGLPAAAVPR